MENLNLLRNFMAQNGVKYLLVNSTNEFLVEYNSLAENSRYKITNFSGSTGEALITPETVYLFVDGRYHIQADIEVDHNLVTVVKLQQGDKYLDKLLERIPENEVLGLFSKKNSQNKYEHLNMHRETRLFDVDPLDCEIKYSTEGNITLEKNLTGMCCEDKIAKISEKISADEAIYLTDLDEVSYLFNMRNLMQIYSAKIKAKALILKDNAILFDGEKIKTLPEFLKSLTKTVYVDKSSINAYDYSLLANPKELKTNPIKEMKACKTSTELEHLKLAFKKTDNAVRAIREYIENNENLSEFDIAVQLAKEFKNQGALGLSFSSIVAKDQNSALAHYSKSSKEEIITEGSLVLIDCGAYFDGGLATDITRVFVKGEASELHKKIYTTVLKAFLQAYNYTKIHTERPVTGYEIDNSVREFFNGIDLDGFVFNHGLGHGIGVNVHEYPPSLSSAELAKVPLKDGMCFSIEPGLYKQGEFGVRLENSCYYKDGQIHSFVHMNYESKLINFDMLNEQEKIWLEEFEVR